ncbi:sialic acid-binding Ig-like lectin 16 [Channa argus]|uniref:sialic acid-binding Ig-like lectin 16 n=1 Tax=Channa argus TaxID=215402 RepID=UPI003521B9BA
MMRKRDTLQSRGEKGAREQDKECKGCLVGETDCLKLQIRMKVFIWATLLFSVRSSNADTGASLGRPSCHYNYCISLIEGEITAEAGLCVVIPCSFITDPDFTPQYVVWFRCEPSKTRCTETDMIFHSNKNNQNVQSEFRERVSHLEPEISQNNCSIIINDLKKSDSGSYQLRVNGLLSGKQDGFTFIPRATVSVKGLSQKPTVMIPPLTEGHQATLTCTAPGLCSGSVPEITWTWRRAGVNDSHITGNITDFKTENLTAVTQRHSSTLTFDPSAEHHGTEVTCKVRFTRNIITDETVTLNVSYVKEVKITGKTSVKKGETLNLTCSVESFPPSFVMWTKLSEQNMQNRTEANLQKDTEPQKQTGMAALSISNVTADHSGQYICTAKHLNHTLKKQANVTVTYIRNPAITGNTTVIMGESLNLTCNVQSFPPTIIMWTKPGPTSLHNGTDTDLQTNSGSATLFIPEMTAKHSGMYRCIVKHMDTTLHVLANVTVIWFPKILSSSGCEVQSDVLTCVCISEGLPLPTTKWPLLENHTEYSVTTTVSNHTVNSTIILTVNHVNTSVECVINNKNWEVKQNFAIRKSLPVQQGGCVSSQLNSFCFKPQSDHIFSITFSTVNYNKLYTCCCIIIQDKIFSFPPSDCR